MCINFEIIEVCKFYSGFLLPFRSQTLVNCTSLNSLRCVGYFYNRLKVICATSKHLERDKYGQVGCSYGYLNRPVAETRQGYQNFLLLFRMKSRDYMEHIQKLHKKDLAHNSGKAIAGDFIQEECL